MADIVMRSACSPAYGTGHLRRCLTIGAELRARGLDVLHVVDDTDLARLVVGSVGEAAVAYVPVGASVGALAEGASTVVLDLPGVSLTMDEDRALRAEVARLDQAGTSVLSIGHAISDSGHLRAVVDLYPSSQIAAVNYVEGPEYLILRPEFASGGTRAPGNRVLVAMGGSDPFDLTRLAVQTLAAVGGDWDVHVVLGAGYVHDRSSLQDLAEASGLTVTFHAELATDPLIELMQSSSVALVAFGTMAYELMALGIPVLALTHYDWQVDSARYFTSLEAMVDLGCAEHGLDVGQLANQVEGLLGDDEELDRLGSRGRQVVDGQGARRVADLVLMLSAEAADRRLDHLYVLAHPGDELFGCGGTIVAQLARGDRVGVVILGEGTTSRLAGTESPSTVRQSQSTAKRALHSVCGDLGVHALYYFRYSDNRFDEHGLLDLVQTVEAVVERHKPAKVWTHHPGDLNVDHRLTFQAVVTATRPATSPVNTVLSVEVPSSSDWGAGLGEHVFVPNVFIPLDDLSIQRKFELLSHYDTELPAAPHPRSVEGLRNRVAHWGHLAGVDAAEAFVLQRHRAPLRHGSPS